MQLERWLYRIPLLVRALFRRRVVRRELDEEIQYHIDQQTQLNIAAGMAEQEARLAARRAFGNVDARKEDCHDYWVVAAIDSLRRDVRYAVRRLGHERTFTIGVVLLLALGIGANVAVFSIVNGVLFKPLEYFDADRLMVVREVIPERDSNGRSVNALHYREWTNCRCFEDIALSEYVQQLNFVGAGDPVRIPGIRVTHNLFSVLGVNAQLGRTFVAADAQEQQASNIVISDRLWRSQFGGRPDVLDQTITLDEATYTIIGVLPPGFRLYPASNSVIDAYGAWPPEIPRWWTWTNNYSYDAIARLAPGVSQQAALEELNAIQASIAETHFQGDSQSLSLQASFTPIHDWVTTRSRAGIYLMFAAVAVALLVACLNIGNLMLVRASARIREAGIRAALGASRLSIFRSIFTESAVLAIAGTAGGVLLAWVGLTVFTGIAAVNVPRIADVQIDATALAVAAAIAVVVTLSCGLLPAIRMTRADPDRALAPDSRDAAQSSDHMLGRQAVVAAQVGLSVSLLIVAGLLLTSFIRVDAVERGYDSINVLTADISLPLLRYGDNEARLNFWIRLRDELLRSPGVFDAGFTTSLPLRGNWWGSTVLREGEHPPAEEHPPAQYRFISAGYFGAMGIPVLRGRALTADDYGSNSAVIAEATANTLWGENDPIGRRFHWSDPELLFEVVGVVPDVHGLNLESEPVPLVYRPLTGSGGGDLVISYSSVAVRMSGSTSNGATLLRNALAVIDKGIAVSNVRTMQQIEQASMGERRVLLQLIGAFAIASLIIAALGIYSVLAYTTSMRSHEIALRMALGAEKGRVVSLVMCQGMWPVTIGVALGLAAAVSLGRTLENLLFEVSPTDWRTLALVVAVTLISALLAALVPARRAADTSLLAALRYE